jgi:hypothetical protein
MITSMRMACPGMGMRMSMIDGMGMIDGKGMNDGLSMMDGMGMIDGNDCWTHA